MAEFVQQFHHDQRAAIGRQPLPAERVDQRCREVVPLQGNLTQAERQHGQREEGESPRAEGRCEMLPASQPRIGPKNRDPKEQVMVQQPLHGAASHLIQPLSQTLRAVVALWLYQLIADQELRHAQDVVRLDLQRGLVARRAGHGNRVVQCPVPQHFECGPVDAEKQIARWIVQRPAGLTV